MGLLSILDTVLFGVRRLYAGSTELPERPAISFSGAGVTVTDNSTDNRTDIAIGPSVGTVPESRKILGGEAISVSPLPGTLDVDLTIDFDGLQTDEQHGERGGGLLHEIATTDLAGFMSTTDKEKLDQYPDVSAMATIDYVDTAIAGVGGGLESVTGTAPIHVDAVDPLNPDVQWQPTADVGMASHGFTACTGLANAAGAVTLSAGAGALTLTASTSIAITSSSGATAIDADSSHPCTLGASTAQSTSIGHGTITNAITGVTDCLYAGVATTATAGRKLRNTTASSVGVTVQYAPSDLLEGHARVSGADKTFQTRWTLRPRTNGQTDLVLEYSSDGGSTWGEFHRFTTATSGQFAFASQSFAFATSQGYWHDSTGSGLYFGGSGQAQVKNYDSSNPVLLYSDGGFLVQTGGANERINIASTGKGRVIVGPDTPTSSGGALTIDLSTSQNQEHAVTEATTVTFTGAVAGMSGEIVFTQGGTGRTVTMPTNGVGVEYDNDILALTLTGIVNASSNARTVLSYYVLASPANRIFFTNRAVSNPIP